MGIESQSDMSRPNALGQDRWLDGPDPRHAGIRPAVLRTTFGSKGVVSTPLPTDGKVCPPSAVTAKD